MVALSANPLPQNVAVVIRIGSGSFADGFAVTLQIIEDGQLIQEHHDLSNLPAAAEMVYLYDEWCSTSLENSRVLQAVSAQVTNVATLEDWRQRTEKLEDYCRKWFQEQSFRNLRDRIQANTRVTNDQSVPILLNCNTGNESQDAVLRRLPWHLWDLFSSRHNTEFALFTRFHHRATPLTSHIRVLAIFGSAQGGLQLDKDAAALQLLQQRGAEIVKRSQPSQEELAQLLFDEPWDILFFAGHSSSQGASGRIQISENVNLPLRELRQSLVRAVARGLKLAIFNSCDGLGIADFLAELHVPALIVMRQPVPDSIACQFLLYFLTEFSHGKPLARAVREARDRLEAMQNRFPGASWLPTLCQNPNQPELVWIAPIQPSTATPRRLPRRVPYLLVGLTVAGAIAVVAIAGRCQIFSSLCVATVPSPAADGLINDSQLVAVNQFISEGQQAVAGSRVTLSEPYRSLKQRGIDAFAQGQYENAAAAFDRLRDRAKQDRTATDETVRKAALTALQDPEVLIYRNNAFVNVRHSKNSALPIYTIAIASPLNLDAGMQIILGVAQAQDVAVQRGINLQVIIANDNNNPNQSEQVAKALSNDGRVLAVIGHYTSPNTCRALRVYSPNHLAVVSPGSTVVDIRSNPDCGGDPNRVFFRTVSNTRIEASSLAQYLVGNLGKSRPKVVAFYNSRESFSKDLFQQLVKAIEIVGGSVIAEFDLADPAFNTRQLPSQIKDADALAILPDGQTGSNATLQRAIDIIKLNNREKPILGASTLYLQDVLDQTGNATVDRLFMAVDWDPKQCGAENFAKQINDYWGGDLNRRTTLSYEAVKAVLQTLTPGVTRQDVVQKLSETGIGAEMGVAALSETIEGLQVSFNEQGDRNEITTRAIVTVSDRLRFNLVKDVPCPKS